LLRREGWASLGHQRRRLCDPFPPLSPEVEGSLSSQSVFDGHLLYVFLQQGRPNPETIPFYQVRPFPFSCHLSRLADPASPLCPSRNFLLTTPTSIGPEQTFTPTFRFNVSFFFLARLIPALLFLCVTCCSLPGLTFVYLVPLYKDHVIPS